MRSDFSSFWVFFALLFYCIFVGCCYCSVHWTLLLFYIFFCRRRTLKVLSVQFCFSFSSVDCCVWRTKRRKKFSQRKRNKRKLRRCLLRIIQIFMIFCWPQDLISCCVNDWWFQQISINCWRLDMLWNDFSC